MDMLTGYAAAHQHPFNVAVHMVGIPTIMFGVFVMLSNVTITIDGFSANLAHLAMLVMFVFYLTLDVVFSLAFLGFAVPVTLLATLVGTAPFSVSGTIAAIAFFGGYAAQFIGHAVEKSEPVILKHPVQANLAAPFFTVVELFHILGLRDDLFNEVQRRVAELQREQAT
ncbi:MAG: DUF962 domain-containing protein [Gammaproteobacteria bacterium]|nr:DUF962 domain-containing protein [Gammaproteobacteria bacterium]